MLKSYWAKAANMTVYLMNRCTMSRVHNITPHEMFYGKKPNLSHIRIFGSIAFIHIPNQKQQNLDPKSETCILVGYLLEQKGYKCFNPSTRKVWVSRDVVFDELVSWYTVDSTPSDPMETYFDIIDSEEDDQLRLTSEGSPISTRLSGPHEPLSNQSMSRASPKQDKGKAKMPEYEDSDGIESDYSFDSEYGGLDVPSMRTLRVPHHSPQEKNHM